MIAKSIKVKAAMLAVLALVLGGCANSSPASGDNANQAPPAQPRSAPYMGY